MPQGLLPGRLIPNQKVWSPLARPPTAALRRDLRSQDCGGGSCRHRHWIHCSFGSSRREGGRESPSSSPTRAQIRSVTTTSPSMADSSGAKWRCGRRPRSRGDSSECPQRLSRRRSGSSTSTTSTWWPGRQPSCARTQDALRSACRNCCFTSLTRNVWNVRRP